MKVYDPQIKKEIALEYINTDISYRALAKKHNVIGNSQIREWVNTYKEYGEEGLTNRNRYKYTKEFKIQLVEEYLNTKKGYKKIAKEYGLKSRNQLRDWVGEYKQFGKESFGREGYNSYTKDFKLKAVNMYLTTNMSYREVARLLEIRNKTTLTRWVQKYRKEGANAFRGSSNANK